MIKIRSRNPIYSSVGQRLRTINQNWFLENKKFCVYLRSIWDGNPDQDSHIAHFRAERWQEKMFLVNVTASKHFAQAIESYTELAEIG